MQKWTVKKINKHLQDPSRQKLISTAHLLPKVLVIPESSMAQTGPENMSQRLLFSQDSASTIQFGWIGPESTLDTIATIPGKIQSNQMSTGKANFVTSKSIPIPSLYDN